MPSCASTGVIPCRSASVVAVAMRMDDRFMTSPRLRGTRAWKHAPAAGDLANASRDLHEARDAATLLDGPLVLVRPALDAPSPLLHHLRTLLLAEDPVEGHEEVARLPAQLLLERLRLLAPLVGEAHPVFDRHLVGCEEAAHALYAAALG